MLTSLILGAIVGAVLGLTGAGGGIMAVPALVAGMVTGRRVSHRLSARHVQVGFAGVLICVALGMMAKAGLGG
jgi:uncharacterized membrane protein YfcA